MYYYYPRKTDTTVHVSRSVLLLQCNRMFQIFQGALSKMEEHENARIQGILDDLNERAQKSIFRGTLKRLFGIAIPVYTFEQVEKREKYNPPRVEYLSDVKRLERACTRISKIQEMGSLGETISLSLSFQDAQLLKGYY